MLSPAPLLGNHANVAHASRVRKFRYIQARKGIADSLEVMFRILSGIRKSSGYPFGSRTAADFDKCFVVMARPEGFEPPTFRFVELSKGVLWFLMMCVFALFHHH